MEVKEGVKVYDEAGEEIDSYDLSKGYLADCWDATEGDPVLVKYVYHEYTSEQMKQLAEKGEAAGVPARVASVEEQLTNLQLAMADIYEGGM